ncbi:MAG: hypothetical protein HFI87_02125 [Bacilli bacterium]|nr:hypothetical protein [Bacilli bacterium]
MIILVYLVLGVFVIAKIIEIFTTKKNNLFDIYIGVPGSGKTTFAAWLTKRDLKKKRDVYCNVPIKDTYKINRSDIGHYLLEHGSLIIDEAGIDYNNRSSINKKSSKYMTEEEIKFYKYHRHFDMDVHFFSQALDVDVTLRRLASEIYLVKRSMLPFCIKRKRILYRIGIDKETRQLRDEYYFQLFGSRHIFSPKLWKMFNSHTTYELPIKEFEKY